MEKTLDGILEQVTPEEARALKAVSAIAHQDGYLNVMSEGDMTLYGKTQIAEREALVRSAAEMVIASGSTRIQGLMNDYLSRMGEVVNGNSNWGKSFHLDVLGIQREVAALVKEVPTEKQTVAA